MTSEAEKLAAYVASLPDTTNGSDVPLTRVEKGLNYTFANYSDLLHRLADEPEDA
jgi:hypothetical protein